MAGVASVFFLLMCDFPPARLRFLESGKCCVIFFFFFFLCFFLPFCFFSPLVPPSSGCPTSYDLKWIYTLLPPFFFVERSLLLRCREYPFSFARVEPFFFVYHPFHPRTPFLLVSERICHLSLSLAASLSSPSILRPQ